MLIQLTNNTKNPAKNLANLTMICPWMVILKKLSDPSSVTKNWNNNTLKNPENTDKFCDIEEEELNENDFKQIDEEIARLPENSVVGEAIMSKIKSRVVTCP
jgi:hypothetical protein